MTPTILREAYLLASAQLQQLLRRRDELRMELHRLEKQEVTYREIVNGLKDVVCAACLGNGWVQHWYAQDDVKSETCERCKGTGFSQSQRSEVTTVGATR